MNPDLTAMLLAGCLTPSRTTAPSMATEDASCATATPPLTSSAASSVSVQSLREQLARQSYAFVRARDMWSLLGVAADTAPSLLALWASTVKVACS